MLMQRLAVLSWERCANLPAYVLYDMMFHSTIPGLQEEEIMTSKQRAYLKGLAMTMDPVVQIGKYALTPEVTGAVEEALAARELIKINVLQNCMDDIHGMASVLAERTHAQVVQVIGRKIVLYREGRDENKKIELPRA